MLTYYVFHAELAWWRYTLFAIYMIDEVNISYVVSALTLGLYCFRRLGVYLGSAAMIFEAALEWISLIC